MKAAWKRFVWGVLSPMLLALALFAGAVFGVILPSLERSNIERKREMIRELTASAWSILAECEQQVRDGRLSKKAAQQLAAEQIRYLRYGKTGREYFWITDTVPRMVMHPYRPDLEGQDLSEFRDPDGIRLFVDFAQIAREQGEGYTAYRWQLYDEPGHIVPKLSFVKLFAPWNWIIGTGLYVDDVRAEIRRQGRRLAGFGLVVLTATALLLLLLTRQSYRIERDRQRAERSLRESEQRYRLLVESAGEGMMLLVEGQVVFLNRPLCAILRLPEGSEAEACRGSPATEWFDMERPGGSAVKDWVEGRPGSMRFTADMRAGDGSCVPVSVGASKLSDAEHSLLFTIRDLSADVSGTPSDLNRSDLPLSVSDLTERISRAACPGDIREARSRLNEVILAGHQQGLKGSLLTRMITDVSDAAVRRCCAWALTELGPAPVEFAFLTMGSEGRHEASFTTDQDNGLIYADPDPSAEKGASEYFERFAQRVCRALAEAGFPLCNGGLMASNPEWCMPASRWSSAIRRWSTQATPDALKGIHVTADHRCVFGDEHLSANLREALLSAAHGSQIFYFNLAKAALDYRPPLDALGKWTAGSGVTLNIKESLTPIVNLARIYALRHGLALVSTSARLKALAEQGGLPVSEAASLIVGFELLLRLRLKLHLDAPERRQPDGDELGADGVSELEQYFVRKILEHTARMQNHLRMDFCNLQT